MSLRQYCIEHSRDTLLREWDAARSGGLTPSDVSFGSHQKVWWQCSKGHSWQAKVYSARRAAAARTAPDARKRLKTRWRCKSPRLKPSGTQRKTLR